MLQKAKNITGKDDGAHGAGADARTADGPGKPRGSVGKAGRRDVKTIHLGQAQGLMPVVPALWEAKVSESLEIRSSRPAWSTW